MSKKRHETKKWISTPTLDNVQSCKASRDKKHKWFLQREIKRNLKEDEKNWWTSKAEVTEEAAGRGDSKTLFKTLNEVSGQTRSQIPAILKDDNNKILKSAEDRLKGWSQYFSKLYNRPDPSELDTELDNSTPIVPEIEISVEPPSNYEIQKAIKTLKNEKSPGVCKIPPEIFKAIQSEGLERL